MTGVFDTVFRDIIASLGHLLTKGRVLASIVMIETSCDDNSEAWKMNLRRFQGRTVQLETICVDFGSIAMKLGHCGDNSVTYKAICDDLWRILIKCDDFDALRGINE